MKKKTCWFLLADCLGTLTKLQCISSLIEVWPLASTEKDIRIDVIGRNPPQWLKKIADTDKAVCVPGFVDDVRPYIERAAVYVCPIMDGGGTKLKILDALAMSKAIVAHPVSCEGIDVRDEEHILFARNPSEFVQQINRLLEDTSLRRRLGQKWPTPGYAEIQLRKDWATSKDFITRGCEHGY